MSKLGCILNLYNKCENVYKSISSRKKIVETINQYNIDEYYINESYGSIERFNQIVKGESPKRNELTLMDFLSEIRPNNILHMQPKSSADNLKIKHGY